MIKIYKRHKLIYEINHPLAAISVDLIQIKYFTCITIFSLKKGMKKSSENKGNGKNIVRGQKHCRYFD